MNTSISHFPPARQEAITNFVQMIKKTINPEKIILFSDPAESTNELLVITSPDENRQDFKIQDTLTNRCRPIGKFFFYIVSIKEVNRGLADGHPFFYNIIANGILLYDSGDTPLAEPTVPDHDLLAQTAEQKFQLCFAQAKAFLKTAQFDQQQKDYPLAMFTLHQAAEHAYKAILNVLIGFDPKTHNLDKLRRYTNRFSADLANLFPCSTAEEKSLFKLLKDAYVDARYKEDYSIAEEQLCLLQGRLRQLHVIAERICLEYLNSGRHAPAEPAQVSRKE